MLDCCSKLSLLFSQVQVKKQLRETKNRKNENSFEKQFSCHENSKSCIRLVINFRSGMQMSGTEVNQYQKGILKKGSGV